MVASSTSSRSIAVLNTAPTQPSAVETFIGNLLELVIHSIEGVRGRLVGGSPQR
ncbi:MAG: hypothetical protein H7138_14740 [Myxococcales bacterium]|nr:hypothetical protein [Myxococcales bacterium]